MSENKAHVANWKKEEVSRLEHLLTKYKIIAVADMTNMPSLQLQRLRSNVKNSTVITMSKGNLIKIAFENLKSKIQNIQLLEEYIRGMPALLLTNDNPFKLARLLRKSKSIAPAKAGQIAPNDIMVPAGPTPFPPGPIIGELSACGLKAAVVDGKVAIKEDKVVVKEGEIISGAIAGILTRLGIEPMEIGINLLAAYENGVIFTKDTLNIDDTVVIANLKSAAQSSFNLAVYIAYPTKDNIKLLIKKAFMQGNSVAEKGNILTSTSLKKELAKANLEAGHLKEKFNLPDSPEPLTGEVKEEIPQEEIKKKPEVKEEPKKEIPQEKIEEEIAQRVLRKLQDEKMGMKVTERTQDKRFKEEEKQAQDVLKKIQDEKLEKEEKKKFKPRGL